MSNSVFIHYEPTEREITVSRLPSGGIGVDIDRNTDAIFKTTDDLRQFAESILGALDDMEARERMEREMEKAEARSEIDRIRKAAGPIDDDVMDAIDLATGR